MSDKHKRDARELMAATPGLTYSRALRAVTTSTAAATATIDPVLLAPYPDESGVQLEELGWRVLPADATPAQRARTEAIWLPVRRDRPCRCSGGVGENSDGPCLHGTPCDDTGETCDGKLIHLDRYPGSIFDVCWWEDYYACTGCEDRATAGVMLPSIPWGTSEPNGIPGSTTTSPYPGVRHPNFRESMNDDGYDPGCDECGARPGYPCTCDDEPGLCDECGGNTDSGYGCGCN